MFSSIRRGQSAAPPRNAAPAALVVVAAAWATQATIRAARPSDSPAVRLGVADPHLDGAEGDVRAHRPPDLGVLDDRVRALEEPHVVREGRPRPEDVGHPAARKALGEGLGAGGVQARVAAVQVRGVRRDGEQQRQDGTQAVTGARPRGRRRAPRRGRAARRCCCARRRSAGRPRPAGSARCR